jgi:hypothetical protein
MCVQKGDDRGDAAATDEKRTNSSVVAKHAFVTLRSRF